ncbi:uncharacterized protein LOC122849894 [Aphidius gifuensis]|uniref:uncharacterized protein LOC122849894 n=1 Tax=Aphidius gifuensis TaxID=684658 RepID=UPI001CDC6C07|nr:uncharacterized protein LOC122849894 [Aphidius gifuensis]
MGKRCGVLNCRHSNSSLNSKRCTVFKMPSFFEHFQKVLQLTGNERLISMTHSTIVRTIGICICHYNVKKQIIGKGKNRRPSKGELPCLHLPGKQLTEQMIQEFKKVKDSRKLGLESLDKDDSNNLDPNPINDGDEPGIRMDASPDATLLDRSSMSIDVNPDDTLDSPLISMENNSGNDIENANCLSPSEKEIAVLILQMGKWGGDFWGFTKGLCWGWLYRF